jgi:acyl-CoA reductase-like NAD-dependent aldehyde dehydrogenase
MLVDGELVPAVSGKTFEAYNPATGAVIANVPEADKKDVDIALLPRAAHSTMDIGRRSALQSVDACCGSSPI